MIPEDFEYPHDIEDDQLFQLVRLGNEVQDFILSHPVGKYLWARARQERVDAISDMEALSPLDPDFDTKYHQIAKRAALPKALMSWCEEAFMSASSAEKELHGRDQIQDQ